MSSYFAPPETRSVDSVGAIVVAAGRAERMRGRDKTFIPLAGLPLVAHSIRTLQQADLVHAIVLVVAEANLGRAQVVVRDEGLTKVTAIVAGGERRQDSVRVGLEALGYCSWVVVHDGARPLLEPKMLLQGLLAARDAGAAVAAVPVFDTVKRVDPDGVVRGTVDRTGLWLVQTPQVFRYDLLRRAHQEVTDDVTDDASMVERLGLPVRVFPGSRRNLKVTTPDDLALAHALLRASLPDEVV